ncbi:hypothetical protein [Maritimibacter sp. UBA3975]|uniref:hypothetical protein n=1 Tax=Maritimibacter sp. UBA3975 TaxID=1946833 RepID=UPI000C0969FB|nr:hypothetical protein [Maritimibacter sp. UBA3975]MAM62113.1 hypothetical protein [Maritimibacter sp.]|tara:strand:- start:14899 stop:15456 length:558 start_codon:yes stop_codon:yes gene_type:complete
MSRTELELPGGTGPRTIWVFLLDIDPARIDTWKAPDPDTGDWPLPGALGLKDLNPAHVEVFPEGQIAEYGLTRYLTDANGMSVESVAEDARTLASLSGVIALVHGKAVAGQTGHFDPAHPARFVGRYQEEATLTVSTPAPASASTQGSIAGGATPGQGPRKMPWGIFVAMVAVIIAVAAVIMVLA